VSDKVNTYPFVELLSKNSKQKNPIF